MQPRAGTDQFVMTRPNPVRRGKSRPVVSRDGFGATWMIPGSRRTNARVKILPGVLFRRFHVAMFANNANMAGDMGKAGKRLKT